MLLRHYPLMYRSKECMVRGPRNERPVDLEPMYTENHRVLKIEFLNEGKEAYIWITLLAAGFVIGSNGGSVRQIGLVTGAILQSCTETLFECDCVNQVLEVRRFRVVGSNRERVEKVIRIMCRAVDKYRELCHRKREGEFVSREYTIDGVDFQFQPPPRKPTFPFSTLDEVQFLYSESMDFPKYLEKLPDFHPAFHFPYCNRLSTLNVPRYSSKEHGFFSRELHSNEFSFNFHPLYDLDEGSSQFRFLETPSHHLFHSEKVHSKVLSPRSNLVSSLKSMKSTEDSSMDYYNVNASFSPFLYVTKNSNGVETSVKAINPELCCKGVEKGERGGGERGEVEPCSRLQENLMISNSNSQFDHSSFNSKDSPSSPKSSSSMSTPKDSKELFNNPFSFSCISNPVLDFPSSFDSSSSPPHPASHPFVSITSDVLPGICIICCSSPVTLCLHPCKHSLFCSSCGEYLTFCPICKEKVEYHCSVYEKSELNSSFSKNECKFMSSSALCLSSIGISTNSMQKVALAK